MTEADKIRSMTDEQLADFLGYECPFCINSSTNGGVCNLDCEAGVLSWLGKVHTAGGA